MCEEYRQAQDRVCQLEGSIARKNQKQVKAARNLRLVHEL